MTPRERHDRPAEPRPVAGREPPRNMLAEDATLSACMLSDAARDEVIMVCAPEDFSGGNIPIAEVIWEQHAAGEPVDIVTVAEELRRRDDQRQGLGLAAVGGAARLHALADASPDIRAAAAHARVVHDLGRERRYIAACQRIAAEGYYDHGPTQGYLDAGLLALEEIARRPNDTAGAAVRDVLREVFTDMAQAAERGGLLGWSTGLRDLDKLLGGLQPGDLTVVGARPGMGKTALLTGILCEIAGARHSGETLGSAMFSLEMPRKQLVRRQVFSRARVDPTPLKHGRDIGAEHWKLVTDAATALSGLPWWIDDTPGLSPLAMRAKARQIRSDYARRGVRLAVIGVDYLQLMNGRAGLPRGASREQEVSECSKFLKHLAKELGVHVIALSQLNRSVEQRGNDRRPRMSDLRESGAVEQDADNIALVYRHDYYFPDCPPHERGIAEILLEKQRNGEPGVVRAKWTGFCTRFDDLGHDEGARA